MLGQSLSYSLNQTKLPLAWSSELDDTLICREIRQETHDVKTFVLASKAPRLFRYAPGQFLTLELEINGQTVNRCYTLSSSPTRPDQVSITVKRVKAGVVSNWLHDNLHVGGQLRVLGPAGDFSCFLRPMLAKQRYLFLSAGSGITPLMSMSRAIHDLSLDADIIFMHSARTPEDIIFWRELELISFNRPRFQTRFICEKHENHPDWTGLSGLLSPAMLKNAAPDFLSRHVYTCGPALYMESVRAMLTMAEFSMSQYHEESFSFEVLQAETNEVIHVASHSQLPAISQFTIEFKHTGEQVSCGPDQTILSAARAAGMRLPTSCTQGLCGTCKTKMVSGQVAMKHAGGIRQKEIDQGWILPCCSKPMSHLVLEK